MPLQGISQIQRCDLQSYQSYCGVQGKGLGDGTNPLRGCLGRNQRCRKGKISDYREKQAWESQGYCDKKDKSPASRLKVSMCIQLSPAYPIRLIISFCNSFLGPPLLPMCIYKTWSQTTGHKGCWVCGASKAGCELLQVWV